MGSDDDDHTPRDARVPLFLFDPPGSGAHREPMDPAYYLTRGPNDRARAIMAAVTRESGDPSPFWMTAAIADRVERNERQLGEMSAAISALAAAVDPAKLARTERAKRKDARNFWLKCGGVAATLLASAIAWYLHLTEARAAAYQRIEDLIQRFEGFDKDIREIRMQLHKLSKAESMPESAVPVSPEKLAFLYVR